MQNRLSHAATVLGGGSPALPPLRLLLPQLLLPPFPVLPLLQPLAALLRGYGTKGGSRGGGRGQDGGP